MKPIYQSKTTAGQAVATPTAAGVIYAGIQAVRNLFPNIPGGLEEDAAIVLLLQAFLAPYISRVIARFRGPWK